MNLPVILDVVIGLIFIYLILSLLASEIQELIATLLQWRAKHLKKSIATLVAGGSESKIDNPDNEEIAKVQQIINYLYNDPLINTLNFEEEGFMGKMLRKIPQAFEAPERTVNNISVNNTVTAKKSGPSYIPNETFSTTLIETLKLPKLIQELGEEGLTDLQKHWLDKIALYLQPVNQDDNIRQDDRAQSIYNDEFYQLQRSFEEILLRFKNRQANLNACIQSMIDQLDGYIKTAEEVIPPGRTKNQFLIQLKILRKDVFFNKNEAVWRGLQPNLALIINSYKEVKDGVENPDSPIHQKIKELELDGEKFGIKLIDRLPKSLTDSLAVLANRAQIKAEDIEEGTNQFKKEIESWFDRSMERSGGVYKRNAKGIALIIGLLISVSANADTLQIVNRLSKDSALRTAITQNAQAVKCPTNEDLACIRDKVDAALTDVSLPLGWTSSNLKQQLSLTEANPNIELTPGGIGQILRIIFGWVLTGMAIAMGAPFWFDLLNKFVNVRNTGKKPNDNDK